MLDINIILNSLSKYQFDYNYLIENKIKMLASTTFSSKKNASGIFKYKGNRYYFDYPNTLELIKK